MNYTELNSTQKDDLTARYEELRAHALGDCFKSVGNPLGLVLIMTEGMVRWLSIYLTGKVNLVNLPDRNPKVDRRDETANSTWQRCGLVGIMADMVITQFNEVLR